MKIVAVEEHFCTPQIRAAWTALDEQLKDDMVGLLNGGEVERHLEDLSDARLRHMDDSGVDVQVLSLTTPGTQSLAPTQAAALARACNDHAADTLRNAIGVLGIDRILFSVDYPFEPRRTAPHAGS